MSNNLVSQQFSVSSQSHLGTISKEMGPSVQLGMMGVGNGGPLLDHSPVEKVDMDVRSSHLISSYQESHLQLMTTQNSGIIEPQEHNVMLRTSFMPQDPAVGARSISPKMETAQVPSKRKLPMEPMSNFSAAHMMSAPNKRMVSVEHRPWLQQISGVNKGPMHTQMQTSSVSPRTQYLPTLSKKTVQLESASSNKPGKQTVTKKQPAPKQLLPKTQSESSESVRCKMRESLAGALALVQQQSEASKDTKSWQIQPSSTSGENHVSSQPNEPISAASRIDTMASKGSIKTSNLGFGCSAEKNSTGQTVSQERLVNDKMSDGKECDVQESQFINPFPQDNISYSDNVFSKDDLLQGNGLSWVLESDIGFTGNVQTRIFQAPAAEDGNPVKTREKSIQDPQLLASKIEAELFKLFGGVNKKYKEKGRSLLFNLKDKNNPELREKVMFGEIPAERLCSMSAEELASKELAEWRQAKAEELAQMVVLPDTQVDIRRLVRKTHKGEFQVEVEPMDSGSVEVSVGSSSLTWSRSKNHQREPPSKTLGKDKANASKEKSGNQKDQGNPTGPTVPGSTGPAKGITVDDEMKDVTGSLPPIVSLDEFMVSVDSDTALESLSVDSGKETPVSDKNDVETSSTLKSPKQSPNDPVSKSMVKPENADTGTMKPDSDVKTEKVAVVIPKGERLWEGSFQISVSSAISVIGIFRSGEKTSAKEWPMSLEIKGRVRLDAFEKFLRELPNSRSRAVMVMCFVGREESSKTEQHSLSEVTESYVSDGRVGFAEPVEGVELYLCPTDGKSPETLKKIVPRNQLDFLKSLDNALIGVVVWRRPEFKQPSSIAVLPSSSNSRRNHHHCRHELGSSTHNTSSASMSRPGNFHDVHNGDGDDDDGDVPPGFGPAVAVTGQDDDDLPEFNFSTGNSSQVVAAHSSQSKVRALIHKYGKPKPLWNRDDDEDDENDIPEWRPQMQTPMAAASLHDRGHVTQMVSNGGLAARPAGVSQPRPSGWLAHHHQLRSGGF